MKNLIKYAILISGCGLMPLEPLAPLGCSKLVAVCICEEVPLPYSYRLTELACHWQWQCSEVD